MAAAGNELSRGQPAAVPRLAPPRADRRGRRLGPQGAVLLERLGRRRPRGARASGSSPRPRRSSTRTAGATATRPSPARASRRRWWPPPPRGCGPRKPNLKVDQVASALRASARDLGSKGWDSATGFGLLSMTGALALRTPAADPHEPNDDMAWIDGRALGREDSAIWRGGKAAAAARAGRQARGPGRRLPHRLPAAREDAGDAQAALRRRRPRRLHPQRDLDRRRRADHRPLAPQREPPGLADAAQPVASARARPSSSPTSTATRARSTPATTSACGASSEAERELALGVGRGQCRERLARLLEAVAALDRHPQVAALRAARRASRGPPCRAGP